VAIKAPESFREWYTAQDRDAKRERGEEEVSPGISYATWGPGSASSPSGVQGGALS